MKHWPAILVLALVSCGDQQTQLANSTLRKGNSHYKSERFLEAIEAYQKASFDGRAVHNQGKAHYRAEEFGRAAEQLDAATDMFSDTIDLAHAHHDLGNARLKHALWADSMSRMIKEDLGAIRMEGDDIVGKVRLAVVRDSLRQERVRLEHLTDSALAHGVKAYQQALRIAPSDEDTRYNLALGQRLLEARRKAKNGSDGSDQDDKPELSENARALIQQADELVEEYRFKEALELLQRGLQADPTLAGEKQYIDKLDVVTKAAEAS